MTLYGWLPNGVDFAYAAFALWTMPALTRVLRGRGVAFNDPLKVLGLLFSSGRYAFVLVRWIYGAHRELLSDPEVIGRNVAQLWALVVLVMAVVVIRGYKALGR